MSARAIREHRYDKSRRFLPCCLPEKRDPLSMVGEGNMFECNPCAIECPVLLTASLIDGVTVITGDIELRSRGTINMPSVDIPIGSPDYKLRTIVEPLNNNAVISDIAYVGDIVGLPPTTPITITPTSPSMDNASLDTSVLGAHSATVVITSTCGVLTVVQPYNVV